MNVSPQEIIIICIGLIASVLLLCAFMPQAILTIKTRNTAALSLLMYIFGTSARAMFSLAAILTILIFVYSNDISINLYASSLPILVCHGINLILNAIVLIIKIANMIKAKKLNISESQLVEITLNQKLQKQQNK